MEPNKLSLESMNIPEHKKQLLKEAFPEVFGEGDKIDFEKLKAALGEQLEQPGRERFGLSWAGKSKLFQLIQEPSRGTLRPAKEESVNWDSTEHVFIEGDNLEVLKLLQKSYLGKIKMIYIDPPYNTGKDFVYPDNYSESLETYLEYTGQKSAEGKRFGVNLETDGRFHSKWLNMMYPRLFLARNLLKEDGIIFVSIDDCEISNGRKLMDEIYGADNFIDCLIWKKRYGGGSKEKYFISIHEYIFVYAKNLTEIENIYIPLSEESIAIYYTLNDHNSKMRGPYRTHPLEAMKSFDERKNLNFPIKGPGGIEIWPKRQWRWGKDKVEKALKENELEFIKDREGNWTVHTKQYLKDVEGKMRQAKPFSIIDDVFTQHGTNEIVNIFGNAKIFDFPKPSLLIKQLLIPSTNNGEDDLIIDFFAGSCTTAHAVLDLNRDDSSNRKFIMVQLPEPCAPDSEASKAGYKTIADIGKERIRRVIKKIKKEKSGQLDMDESKQDLGFRVYRLDTSNFKQWQAKTEDGAEAVKKEIELFVDPFLPSRSEEDILSEILLKSGFELSAKVEEIKIAKKKVYSIADGALLICLEEEIHAEFINAIAAQEPHQFICLDKAFHENDDLKANALLTFKSKQNADGTPKTIFKTV
jgi:adenine-specific DNA-methyltransferase